jgi:hypothetical protein
MSVLLFFSRSNLIDYNTVGLRAQTRRAGSLSTSCLLLLQSAYFSRFRFPNC